MPRKVPSFDMDDLISRYRGGESVKALAEAFPVSRPTIHKLLRDAGIQTRNRSEGMATRMARTTPEERSRLAAAAHTARRGSTDTVATRHRRALTNEGRTDGNVSVAEIDLGIMLRAHGLPVIHQKAIGPYNVDIATGSVAVEVLGGNWHRTKPHRKRLSYLLNSGWDVIYIWVDGRHFPLGPAAAQYVVTHTKFRESHPTVPRSYWVIRGTGQLVASGGTDNTDIPDVIPDGRSTRRSRNYDAG